MVDIVELVCTECGYSWTPRVPNPKACPNCKSRYWQGKGTYAKVGRVEDEAAQKEVDR